MTTLIGTNTFQEQSTAPTPGTPRTAQSVNTPLQLAALNNTVALSRGYHAHRYAVTSSDTTFPTVTERLVLCMPGSAPSGDVTVEFVDEGDNGTIKEVYCDSVDQGTVFIFKRGATIFSTWTAPAAFSGLSLFVIRRMGVFELLKVSSPYRGFAYYTESDIASLGGTLSITKDMENVYIDDGTAGTINGTFSLRCLDHPGAFKEFTFGRMSAGASVMFKDTAGTTFATYNRPGYTTERTIIQCAYNRLSGWKMISAIPDEQSTPNILEVSPAQSSTVNPNTYRYAWIDSANVNYTITITAGSYYGQRFGICVQRVNSPSGKITINYGSNTYVLSPMAGSVTNVQRAAEFVWTNIGSTDMWMLLGGGQQT